jgi:hypothetical protein
VRSDFSLDFWTNLSTATINSKRYSDIDRKFLIRLAEGEAATA